MLQELAILEIRELGTNKHGRVKEPVETQIGRLLHEQAMEESDKAWHESGACVRDEGE